MLICQLPTRRLRFRAMQLAHEYKTIMDQDNDIDQTVLEDAFIFTCTDEQQDFWISCQQGDWDTAKSLQPDLFKPMDGKPHIKLTQDYFNGDIWLMEVLCHDGEEYTDMCITCDLELWKKACEYCDQVNSKTYYYSVQQAVDSLYSYKRD